MGIVVDSAALLGPSIWTSRASAFLFLFYDNEIDVPNMDDPLTGKGRRSGEVQEVTNLQYYRVEVFCDVIDLQIQELNARFPDSSIQLLLCVACLSPSNWFSRIDKKKLMCLAEYYPNDFSPIELILLDNQLETYLSDVRSSNDFLRLNTISELGKKWWRVIGKPFFADKKIIMVESRSVNSLVYLLLTLALVLPVATAKRAFSGLNTMKNRLANETGDLWMSDRLVLYLEQDIIVGVGNDTIPLYKVFKS